MDLRLDVGEVAVQPCPQPGGLAEAVVGLTDVRFVRRRLDVVERGEREEDTELRQFLADGGVVVHRDPVRPELGGLLRRGKIARPARQVQRSIVEQRLR